MGAKTSRALPNRCRSLLLLATSKAPLPLHIRRAVLKNAADMHQAAALERLAKRKEQIAKKAEQGRAKTFEQLVELGKSRNYKHPVGWARKVMASRHF